MEKVKHIMKLKLDEEKKIEIIFNESQGGIGAMVDDKRLNSENANILISMSIANSLIDINKNFNEIINRLNQIIQVYL